MTKQEVATRARRTMAQVFNIAPETITDNTSPDAVEAWDSVGHMNLIIALEEEFGISFNDDQSVQLKSFELVVCLSCEALRITDGSADAPA